MQARTYLAAALLCYCALPLAAQQIDDPANLMGERVSPPALADTLPIDHGAPALEQLLRKLRTRASMMLIVAHPDDEDSGLLTYESRGMGARVAMLTLTRGEGGQNLMTGDFNDALGLIRTQELLAEDRYTGTDQFFGTEVDFGFSKTKEEAFKQWTHERVLYDAVRAVRLYRPLVLASVFIGGVTDGHGQHQVSGEITQEVFLAAADPKVFPEMGLPPWAPLKVYARVPFAPITDKGMFDYATGKYLPPHFHNYVTGVDTTAPPQATVTIHEGEVPDIPAFEGKSYVQWARQGLALQKTQIGANFRIPPAGRVDVGYTLYGSRTSAGEQGVSPAKNTPAPGSGKSGGENEDLFAGVDVTLPGTADLAPHAPPALRTALVSIDAKAAEAQHLFKPDHPELTALPLGDALKQLDALITQTEAGNLPALEKFDLLHELRIKRVQFNNALVLALGVTMTAQAHIKSQAYLDRSVAIVASDSSRLNQPFDVGLDIKADTGQPLSLLDVQVNRSPDGKSKARPLGSVHSIRVSTALLTSFGITRPYFSRNDLAQPFYNIARPSLRNAPASPYLAVNARLSFAGVSVDLSRTIESEGRPLELVPPVSVSVSPRVQVRPESASLLPISVVVTSQAKEDLNGTLRPDLPNDWSSQPIDFRLNLNPDVQEAKASFRLTRRRTTPGQSYTVSAPVTIDGEFGSWAQSYRAVGYAGLPTTNYYMSATSRISESDLTTAPNLHIAYLYGTGDEVPEFLPSLGVTPTVLSTKDLTVANLRQYDAVVLGVRAYSAHPELEGAGSAGLNEYARAGRRSHRAVQLGRV